MVCSLSSWGSMRRFEFLRNIIEMESRATLSERLLRISGRSCCSLETSSMIWSSEILEDPDCLDLLLDIPRRWCLGLSTKISFEGFNIEAGLTKKETSRKSFFPLRAKLRLSRGRRQGLLGIIHRGSAQRHIKRKDHKEISRGREKEGERVQ